jgi:ribosomal protein L11 methyltransferase
MIWLELSTQVEAEAVEAVAELFERLGQGGVAVEQPISKADEFGEVVLDTEKPITVKTYLPEGDGVDEKIRRAEEALWHLSMLRRVEPLRITRLAEEDWAEAWKEHFFVQRIGARLVIKPSWREYEPLPADVVIELDPGMAFGTGLHPTTRGCLLACERYLQEGVAVLDVGAGSGILSIAAAKLGAAFVTALEIDQVALDVARKNVAANGLEARVRVLGGSLERLTRDGEEGAELPEGTGRRGFDVVLANIIASVIVELAEGLREAVAPGGLLVASGIIDEREPWVRDSLGATGLKLVETVADGDWRTMVWRRGRA